MDECLSADARISPAVSGLRHPSHEPGARLCVPTEGQQQSTLTRQRGSRGFLREIRLRGACWKGRNLPSQSRAHVGGRGGEPRARQEPESRDPCMTGRRWASQAAATHPSRASVSPICVLGTASLHYGNKPDGGFLHLTKGLTHSQERLVLLSRNPILNLPQPPEVLQLQQTRFLKPVSSAGRWAQRHGVVTRACGASRRASRESAFPAPRHLRSTLPTCHTGRVL